MTETKRTRQDFNYFISKMSSKGLENPIIASSDIEDLIKEIKIFDNKNDSMEKSSEYTDKLTELTKRLVETDFENSNTTLQREMHKLRRELKINPKNSEIVGAYRNLIAKSNIVNRNLVLEDKLKLKGTRSHSGVVVITVLTSPGKFR